MAGRRRERSDERQPDLFPIGPRDAGAGDAPSQGAGAPRHAPGPGEPLAPVVEGPIRVGTSGYSFADWVGPFYPAGTPRGRMLDFYRQSFSTVEINATYYRLPPPSTMQGMIKRTPPGFHFMVKLPGGLTHRRDRDPEPVEGFFRTIEPLRAAERFTGALAQFPPSFRREDESQRYLAWMRDAFPGLPLFVEFRHDSWKNAETLARLDDAGLGFCSIDEPDLPGLIPRWAERVGEVAYVRLHGRNARDWNKGGGLRYNYLYAPAELEEWAETIRRLADGARQTYVFFNNCHAGHAVVNARMMKELLATA